MAPLMNRDITIDADGIILLYKKEENLSKNLAIRYMADIKKGFKKATGSDCDIKAVTADDLDSENIIDFWDLPAPAKDAAEEEAPLNKNADPLDTVLRDFPEIVENTDGREFLDFNPEDGGFSQSSFDDAKEEFLEKGELPSEEE